MASHSMEQHLWDSSRHQARETEQSQWLEIQLVTRTVCHTGRRCCHLGRSGSSNILPIRVQGGLEVLICWKAGGKRVAGCWWSEVLHAASSGTSIQSSPGKTKSKVFYRISSWHTVSLYTVGKILVRKEEGGHLFLHFLNKWWDVWILQEGRTFTKHPWPELLILVNSKQLVQSCSIRSQTLQAWSRTETS